MYGLKYVETYRGDIESLYNFGEEDKKNKKSPAQMLEYLESRYPNEFCLQSENDIKQKSVNCKAKKNLQKRIKVPQILKGRTNLQNSFKSWLQVNHQ